MTNQTAPEFVEAIAAWALKDAARRSPVEAVERALADYGSPKVGTDEYVSVRHAAVVKSTTARLDVSWAAEQSATRMDEVADITGTQHPSMFRAAVEAAAGALPDAPSATVEQVTLAVLRVALPLHETQHANALKAAHERAVHFEWELERLRTKVAGLDDRLNATVAVKGSNRYAGQGQLITLLTVDDVREMISEWRGDNEAAADLGGDG
jgi:hypothetical protein